MPGSSHERATSARVILMPPFAQWAQTPSWPTGAYCTAEAESLLRQGEMTHVDRAASKALGAGKREDLSALGRQPGPVCRSLFLALAGLLGCWTGAHPPPLDAASEDIRASARACAELDWRDQGGAARAENYREAVRCFRALYVRVAGGGSSSEAFEKELAKRVDELEAAYHQSRDTCHLRQQLRLEDGGCGSASLSPQEFVTILKTMILDEDAGWVNRDPALAKALRLDE